MDMPPQAAGRRDLPGCRRHKTAHPVTVPPEICGHPRCGGFGGEGPGE